MTHILIPHDPSIALLRPFAGCPESELPLAYAAMVRIAEVLHARDGRSCLAQIKEPSREHDLARMEAERNDSLDRYRFVAEVSRTEAKAFEAGFSSGWSRREAGAAPAAAAGPAPATFMTEDRTREWAWGKVREEVGTKGWTTGDSCNFYGFYLWGWNYRGQYEQQRTATLTALKQELTAAPALEAPAAGLHDIGAGVEVMAWLRENRAPHSIYSKMSACLFGDPDKPRAALAAAPQAPAAPVCDNAPFNKATQDQIAAVMLQRGTPEQQRQALAYASGAAPAAPAEPVTPPVIDERAMKEAFDSATAEGKSFNDALRAAACATIWKRAARADGAPNAVPAAMSAIATECALHAEERHSYLPDTPAQAATWRPHDWVLQAMSRAISFDHMMNQAAPAAPAVDAPKELDPGLSREVYRAC